MKIFDGVELKPALTPTMQGVISWALLLANTVLEADRNYGERIARETGSGRPLTLDHVMAQSGLRIPGLGEAVEQLMGGTEEAKQIASLIVDNPDPAVLVQKFAERLGVKVVAEPAPAATTTPPPPSTPPTAIPFTPPSSVASTVSVSPQVRADRARETGAAATVSETPAALPAFRADFTREAREASKAPTPSANPPASAHAAEPAAVRPSLVGMIEHQLGALRRRMKAHQAELDVRLKRAEAELVELRRELDTLRAERPRAIGPSLDASHGSSPAADAPVAGDRPAVVTTESADQADTPVAGDRPAVATAESAPEFDADLTLPAASEPEAIHAARLISDFAEEVEDHHQQNVARIIAVERELSVTRALVERERDAGGAATHG